MVGVAQLVRALDCGSSGRGFESPRPPQDFKLVKSAKYRYNHIVFWTASSTGRAPDS